MKAQKLNGFFRVLPTSILNTLVPSKSHQNPCHWLFSFVFGLRNVDLTSRSFVVYQTSTAVTVAVSWVEIWNFLFSLQGSLSCFVFHNFNFTLKASFPGKRNSPRLVRQKQKNKITAFTLNIHFLTCTAKHVVNRCVFFGDCLMSRDFSRAFLGRAHGCHASAIFTSGFLVLSVSVLKRNFSFFSSVIIFFWSRKRLLQRKEEHCLNTNRNVSPNKNCLQTVRTRKFIWNRQQLNFHQHRKKHVKTRS